MESDKILTQRIQDQLMYQWIGRKLLFDFLYRCYFIVTLCFLPLSLSLSLFHEIFSPDHLLSASNLEGAIT